ncbi:vWA domain-containing protein [Halosolutus halophilus]|uniref:vWA domain-containing protein n=1 Tax=Halosolutus halophilus TaxID=1552990 RepID=UPI00223516BA|nr:VWA domain-containing protein [Halosolutus halophilus]
MGFSKERLGAVLFAVLMATSLVAMPALASGPSASAADERTTAFAAQTGGSPGADDGPPGRSGGGPPGQDGGPPGHDRGDANVTIPDLEANTTLEAIVSATERLGELEIDGDDAATTPANDTVEAVNASLQEYRRVRYADSRAAFEHLAEAQRALATLRGEVDGEDEAIVDAISADLYAAGNATARLAVSDANVVVAANEGGFRDPGQRQKAESALGNAVDALDRADETVSRDAPGGGKGKKNGKSTGPDRTISPDDRAKALTHLENAWKHAERALDTVEANSEPSLSLSQGRAFERNGTVLVQLGATLTDVRPYAYDEANVTVDGDADAEPLSLVAGESAGSIASGTTLVDVGPDLENVTVTVTATAAHDADRTVEATHEIRVDEDDVIPDRPAPDEYREVEVSDESSGVSVDVGGDGLHETDISITDETPETDDAYRAGPMVRIESQRDIDEATVEIPLDETALEREGNLSIATWDPDSDEPWTPVETEIDHDNGTATAEVDHFSFFSVFWIEEWEDETSDTITLDDNATDGGNGGAEFELIDVMFVVDESGSMGGSRIRNAREASKRFVGALTDEEQAGLVGYAYGGSLKHRLTRDHDSLNQSIDDLNAGGSTNTGAGLQEALDEFERNGWENRSQTIILLSDGHTNRGPDPVGVAETAADRGIEISTIGVGNGIDENELREIAATTGGDFYHVENADDLPETFERVAENETQVQLQDTNRDGIPDLVAEMNLSMPTGGPGVVGEPLDLDPIALDTSGDGIRDNETVDIDYRVFQEDNETKLYASVAYAEHHPARIDTTGDGLTDAEQLEEREIRYTASREDSLDLLSELEGADDVDDLDGLEDDLLETDRVTADPLVNDTDGDGVSDVDEVQLGTNPESRDTTGDGISDGEALDRGDDPTLFDIAPPEITVTYATFNDPDADLSGWDPRDWSVRVSGSYEVEFFVYDPAGLDEARVVRDGDVEETVSLSGTSDDGDVEFEIGTVDTFTDAFAGSRVTVQAEDRHGTVDGYGTAEVAAVEVGGVWSAASDAIRAQGITHTAIERDLGFLQGMTTGAGESIDGLRALYNEPVETIAALREIPNAILNLDEIIASMPDAIDAQQERNNPHDPEEDEDLYEAYRQGWYGGYLSWFVVEAVIPAGEAGKALSSSKRVQSAVDTISTPQMRRAAQMAGRASHTAKAPVRYSRYQLSRALAGTFSLGDDAVSRLLGPGRSTGKQVDNVKTAGKLDEQTVRIVADGSGELDESFRRAVYRAADDDAVSYSQIDRAVRKVDELDGVHRQRTKELIADAPGAGVKFVDEIDANTIRRLTDYDGDSAAGMRESLARHYSSGTVTDDQIDAFGRNLNDLHGNVDGVEGVIAKDIAPPSSTNNVRGALYEFRVANEYVDNPNNVRYIGKEYDGIDATELTDDQFDRIIDEISFADADTRAERLRIIDNALGGGPELDVVKTNGKYLEAKSSTGAVRYRDIREKIIRYKAQQAKGNIDPSAQMEVVAPDGAFTKQNGGLNKIGKLIEETDGVTKGTLDSLGEPSPSTTSIYGPGVIGTPAQGAP